MSEKQIDNYESEMTVFVVEDDEAMRHSIGGLLGEAGFEYQLYDSPRQFYESFDGKPGCLVLDLRLPEVDGVELYRQLTEQGTTLPFVMISGNSDTRSVVDSIRLGAIDFLEKPFRTKDLVDCIHRAFKKCTLEFDTRARLKTLTARETEFLGYLNQGLSVKVISEHLDISPKTGHVHRHSVHQKMNVTCDAALVKLLYQIEGEWGSSELFDAVTGRSETDEKLVR